MLRPEPLVLLRPPNIKPLNHADVADSETLNYKQEYNYFDSSFRKLYIVFLEKAANLIDNISDFYAPKEYGHCEVEVENEAGDNILECKGYDDT